MTVDVVSKEGRQKCWDSKDAFWKCLDANNGDSSKCKAERISFESDCSKTWVKYFDRRRDYLKFKKTIESGDADVINEFINSKTKK